MHRYEIKMADTNGQILKYNKQSKGIIIVICKILKEQITNFLGKVYQNSVRPHTIFPGDHTSRTDILQNCFVGCFRFMPTL